MLGGKIVLFLLCSSGGVLWIMSGIVMAMAPAGNSPFRFRTPIIDVRSHLAIGLLLIGLSLSISMLSYAGVKSRKLTVSCFVPLMAGAIYVTGRLVRDAFLQSTGWEPLLPFGFLLFIGGLITMGIVSLQQKAVPKTISVLLIATAISLLFFNDQYLPFMAVPFGLGVIALSALLGLSDDTE
jgi:uncharacterized membrane protein YgdD (TMEM256/DUF423 family)